MQMTANSSLQASACKKMEHNETLLKLVEHG